MERPDPDSLAELIADCAEIPNSLRPGQQQVPKPRTASPWEVDEVCLAAVNGLDEYV